jgi:hypothetical protein
VIITYLLDIYTCIDVDQNPRRTQGQLHDASDGGARRQRHCGNGVSRISLSFVFLCEVLVKTFSITFSLLACEKVYESYNDNIVLERIS